MSIPSLKHPAILLATWFGLGRIPYAPGTWGSLGAIPPALLIMHYGGALWLGAAAIAITLIGLWAAHIYETKSQSHDASAIVIDEVAGQWLALIPAGLNPLLVVLAFLGFRFFDITKLGPIGYADKKIGGAAGVMADDIIAGLFAGAFVALIQYGLAH